MADVVPDPCSSPSSWRRSLPPITSQPKDLLSLQAYNCKGSRVTCRSCPRRPQDPTQKARSKTKFQSVSREISREESLRILDAFRSYRCSCFSVSSGLLAQHDDDDDKGGSHREFSSFPCLVARLRVKQPEPRIKCRNEGPSKQNT